MKVPFAPPALHAPLLATPPLLGFDAPPLDLAAGSDLASASSLLLADDAVAGFDPVGAWTAFQDSHAVLLSFIAFIIYRAVIQEARMRIEKPIMDEAGRRVAENLTPDTKKLDGEAYAKLAGCIVLTEIQLVHLEPTYIVTMIDRFAHFARSTLLAES